MKNLVAAKAPLVTISETPEGRKPPQDRDLVLYTVSLWEEVGNDDLDVYEKYLVENYKIENNMVSVQFFAGDDFVTVGKQLV